MGGKLDREFAVLATLLPPLLALWAVQLARFRCLTPVL
jgi:hypothetical protein